MQREQDVVQIAKVMIEEVAIESSFYQIDDIRDEDE